MPRFSITLLALTALSNMFILRKAKDLKSLLFWAMFFILVYNIIRIYWHSTLIGILSIACLFFAYFLFFNYFLKSTYNKFTKKISEADKKLSAYDRSVEVEVKKRVFNIELSNEKLVNISKTDSLTKTINKAAIFETIEKLIALNNSSEFCILMFDVDNFKHINDQYGHIEGDKCLKKIALMSKSNIRESDSLGRYGGDEFVIILPQTSLSQAKMIAEKFRKKVDSSDKPHYSVSIGIASFPQDGVTAKELISIADEGLYISKKNGRNTVSHRNLY
jgi:diguanylate cyclase (GGDEF)-like protein